MFILLLWICSLNLLAQEAGEANERAFSFYYANDVSGQTDQYYTNGIKFELMLPFFSKSLFNLKWLESKNGTRSYHSLKLEYDVFTPNLHSSALIVKYCF